MTSSPSPTKLGIFDHSHPQTHKTSPSYSLKKNPSISLFPVSGRVPGVQLKWMNEQIQPPAALATDFIGWGQGDFLALTPLAWLRWGRWTSWAHCRAKPDTPNPIQSYQQTALQRGSPSQCRGRLPSTYRCHIASLPMMSPHLSLPFQSAMQLTIQSTLFKAWVHTVHSFISSKWVITMLPIHLFHLTSKYSWPLNNTGLSCTGPL